MPTSTYRNLAGLPNANWGTSYIKGSVELKNIMIFRFAKNIPIDKVVG